MKHDRTLRRAAENPYVQTTVHVAGDIGAGLLLAPLLQFSASTILAVMLVGVAVLGHWYAVWSGPNKQQLLTSLAYLEQQAPRQFNS